MAGSARKASQAATEVTSLEEARAAADVPAEAPSETGRSAPDPLIGDLRRAGLLPLLVLHLVGESPTYGNQLMDRIAALTRGALAVNPNTMYPLLRSLEARGLIRGEWEHPERRSRRFYRCTPEGRLERANLAAELGPRLDRIAASIESIRSELG